MDTANLKCPLCHACGTVVLLDTRNAKRYHCSACDRRFEFPDQDDSANDPPPTTIESGRGN